MRESSNKLSRVRSWKVIRIVQVHSKSYQLNEILILKDRTTLIDTTDRLACN